MQLIDQQNNKVSVSSIVNLLYAIDCFHLKKIQDQKIQLLFGYWKRWISWKFQLFSCCNLHLRPQMWINSRFLLGIGEISHDFPLKYFSTSNRSSKNFSLEYWLHRFIKLLSIPKRNFVLRQKSKFKSKFVIFYLNFRFQAAEFWFFSSLSFPVP